LGASINFKEMFLGIPDPNGWQMTPGANIYKNILRAFKGNPDFFIFFYDWRKPVLENAQKLHDFIQNTVNPPNNKVNLIGHSLGGLVNRTCVQKTSNNCFAEKLITVGSPHSGAVDAYPALEGGEVWRKGLTKLWYELLIHYFQKPVETRKETLQRIAPVLYDLLPSFDYLTKNGANLPPSNLSLKNLLLPDLQDLTLLEGKTKTVSGRGFNSVERIFLTEPDWLDKLLGNWPDGKPIDKELTEEGDTSILVKSAKLDHPDIENFTYNLDHGGIISEQTPLTKIFENIGEELPADTYSALNETENFLVFFVHSPVKLFSPDTTEEDFVGDELIVIPDPQNKTYILNLEGLTNDYYSSLLAKLIGQQSPFSHG